MAQPPSLMPTPADMPAPNRTSKFVPPSRRRDKPQLSCTLCRRRKLKCDRNQPCNTCASRGLSLSCTYVSKNVQRPGSSTISQPPAAALQARIEQLERLVTSLVGGLNVTEQSSQIATSDTDPQNSGASHLVHTPQSDQSYNSPDIQTQLADSFGRISLENAETSYVSSNHWLSILDGITELKDHFKDQGQPQNWTTEPLPSHDGPELLYGHKRHATKEEILSAIPPRYVVDYLISRHFISMDMASVMLHPATFQKEYERFWHDPFATSTIWIGLLFGIMTMACYFQVVCPDDSEEFEKISSALLVKDPSQLVRIYREKAVQCLILGQYTKAGPYTIEALIVYFTSEYIGRRDTNMGVWIISGIMVRMALRMGYHRDPSHSAKLTPFQGEIRRRVWGTIVQIDHVTSTQIGLPQMIREGLSDTQEPLNLLDSDLDEDMTELPPPRPISEATAVLFTNQRNKLVQAISKISDAMTSNVPYSYAEVLRWDGLLLELHNATPSGLRLKPIIESIADGHDVVLRRIHLYVIFHRMRCFLHQKYLELARSQKQYSYSRQSCLDSALKMLQQQVIIHSELQPGGKLYFSRWKITPVMKHDFLFATTLLCFDLDQDIKSGTELSYSDTPESIDLSTKISALQHSYSIWKDQGQCSQEAHKAAEAVRIVLKKAHNARPDLCASLAWPEELRSSPATDGSPQSLFTQSTPSNEFIIPEDTPALDSIKLDMPFLYSSEFYPLSSYPPMTNVFDWNAFDQN